MPTACGAIDEICESERRDARLALLGLGGCDKLGIAGSAASDSRSGQKLDSYVAGYNALFDTIGLERQAQDYRASNILPGAVGNANSLASSAKA